MIASSKDTRLLEVAIDLFGRDGMNAVGTRVIAEAADAQMSAITYHFGGKEGLYLACARHIGAQMQERMQPMMERARLACAEPGGAEAARDAILAILSGFVDIMMKDDIAPIARFVVREQMNPTSAFEILYETAMRPLWERLEELLKRVAARPLPPEDLHIRVVGLIGQVLAFRFSRATLMKVTGWKSVGAAETEAVRAVVIAHARAILCDLEQSVDP